MDSDGESMSGDELSPEVEQFLAPRPAAPLGESVLSSAVAGVVASFAALVVLLAWQQSGLGDFLLPARVTALEAVGNPSVVDSAVGLGALLLLGFVLGGAVGALFGVVLAKFIGEVSAVVAVGVGLTYGLLVWIIGQYVVVASVSPHAVVLANQHALLVAHLTYGALLGLLSGWSKEPPTTAVRSSPLRRLWG